MVRRPLGKIKKKTQVRAAVPRRDAPSSGNREKQRLSIVTERRWGPRGKPLPNSPTEETRRSVGTGSRREVQPTAIV